MHKPMSAKDGATALDSGGLAHKAKNLYMTVFPTLMRMKKMGEVERLKDGLWALSEWYDRKGAQTQAQSAEEA